MSSQRWRVRFPFVINSPSYALCTLVAHRLSWHACSHRRFLGSPRLHSVSTTQPSRASLRIALGHSHFHVSAGTHPLDCSAELFFLLTQLPSPVHAALNRYVKLGQMVGVLYPLVPKQYVARHRLQDTRSDVGANVTLCSSAYSLRWHVCNARRQQSAPPHVRSNDHSRLLPRRLLSLILHA